MTLLQFANKLQELAKSYGHVEIWRDTTPIEYVVDLVTPGEDTLSFRGRTIMDAVAKIPR